MDELLIEVSHMNGVAVLSLRGEIDMATAPRLRTALEDAQKAALPIVLDMADVTFMDSAGINALIDAAKDSAANQSICVQNPSDAVRQLLEITGLAAMFSPSN